MGIIYSHDLQQKNEETIFLTQKGNAEYRQFKKEFKEKKVLIFKLNSTKTVDEFQNELSQIKEHCSDECDIISAKELPSSFQNMFKLEGENFHAFVLIANDSPNLIRKIVDDIKSKAFWSNIQILGIPYTNLLLDDYSKSIKEKLFPMLFCAVALFLMFMAKNYFIGILLFIPCLLSASLSLTFTKLIFSHSNLINSIVPLLSFIINLALVLHLYFTSKEFHSFYRTWMEKKTPVLLMILTTSIGFSSLVFSELQAIKEFGLFCAGMIILSSLLTLVWFYLVEKFLYHFKNEDDQLIKDKLIQWGGRFFSPKTIGAILLVSLLAGVLTYSHIKIITDANEYFPKNSKIKENMNEVAKSVVGTPLLEVILPFDKNLTLNDLNNIAKLESELELLLQESPQKIEILSMNRLVQKANMAYTGEESLPTHMISYQTISGRIPMCLRGGYPLKKQYRITILGPVMNVDRYEDLHQIIDKYLSEKQQEFQYNGLYYHLMIAQKKMIHTLFKSFLATLFLISLIGYFAFKQFKVFLLFLTVNIFPVFLSFFFMKLFGLSFNIATVMTYSISLGLIVDSSFHLIHALNNKNMTEVFFYKTIVRPILGTGVLLSLCFSFFVLNNFLPIREFGLALSIIILIGTIFDLKVLPTLYLGRKTLK